MDNEDIRWLPRLSNFEKVYRQLDQAVALSHTRELSELEQQGVIQAFEYTYELAWNVIRER